MSGGQGSYYVELAREDYYLEGGEPPGLWWGRGAEQLGLQGEVAREQLSQLFEGRRPDGAGELVQVRHFADGRTRQPGWDLTFSAPKTVSVVWSQASAELRADIQKAHLKAVRQALRYLETEAGFSRRGHGGTELSRAGLIAALFEHGTSRAADPQLHTHALVLNAAVRLDDGTFGTLRSRDLYIHKMAAGVFYRAALAGELRKLGFELELSEKAFEIRGIPKSVVEFFSKRRVEIRAAMSAAGASGAKAAEAFTLATRKVKEHVARGELFEQWCGHGERLGFKLEGLERGAKELGAMESVRELRMRIGRAVKELNESKSYFTERDVLRAVLEKGQHRGFDVEVVQACVAAALKNPATMLELPLDGPYARYTTREMYALEERLLAIAGRLRAREGRIVPATTVASVLTSKAKLNPEQCDVVRVATRGNGSLQLIEGMAGTGKTTVLNAAREAWEKEGLKPIGCALSGKAKGELSSAAGIPSMTIAKLLFELGKSDQKPPAESQSGGSYLDQAKRAARANTRWQQPTIKLSADSVLVVDEAGMVGTRMLTRLFDYVERAGARIVLVGDPRQLQPIEAGGPFQGLIDRFGATRLTHIVRQEQEWMRSAVYDFANGDARAALTRFLEHDRLMLSRTHESAIQSLVACWGEQRTKNLSETLIVAGTNQDVVRLNQLAQQGRVRAGELDENKFAEVGSTRFLVGDRLLLTRNNARLGVFNGDFGTVLGVTRRGAIKVELDRQERGRSALAELDPDAYPHIQLGYASTTHKAQGATVDKVFVLAGGSMGDRELSYVQTSRARKDAFIAAAVPTIEEDLAELARSMSTSHQKELAHTLTVAVPAPAPGLISR